MLTKRAPGIYLTTDAGLEVDVLLADWDGSEHSQPRRLPGQDLIDFLERDYSAYRNEILTLWDTHPLFDERIDIPEADYEDFSAQALALPEEYLKDDPIAYLSVVKALDNALHMPDDGSAMFLLLAGRQLIKALEGPFFTQARLDMIFKETFDAFERGTQQQRFEHLKGKWPDVANRFFTCRSIPEKDSVVPLGGHLEYATDNMYDFYLIELSRYFSQDKYRIAQCQHCFEYFIPETRKKTLYCNRIYDGQSCKQAGPNQKRKRGPGTDEVRLAYDRARDRMYARLERYEDAGADSQVKKLTAAQYSQWLTTAQRARKDYVAGKITVEKALKIIDMS